MESNKDALDAPGKSLVALCLSGNKHRYFNTVSRCGTNMSYDPQPFGSIFCTIRYKMNLPTANIKEREDVEKSLGNANKQKLKDASMTCGWSPCTKKIKTSSVKRRKRKATKLN